MIKNHLLGYRAPAVLNSVRYADVRQNFPAIQSETESCALKPEAQARKMGPLSSLAFRASRGGTWPARKNCRTLTLVCGNSSGLEIRVKHDSISRLARLETLIAHGVAGPGSRGRGVADTGRRSQTLMASDFRADRRIARARKKRSWYADPSSYHDLYPETGHLASRPPGKAMLNISATPAGPLKPVLPFFPASSIGRQRRRWQVRGGGSTRNDQRR